MAGTRRSPKYPFIPLSKALERAEQLYRAEGKNYTPMTVATGHWAYKPKSSGGLQTIGALIGYGLLEDVGSGADRKVRVTELARRILLDQRPESTERNTLIREAALTPTVFGGLWSLWKDVGIPSASSMRHTLVFEHDFNENTVDDFISVFSQTIEFAGLTSADGHSGPDDDSNSLSQREGLSSTVPHTERGRTTVRQPQLEKAMQEATFPLAEGLAVVQWPKELSKESYEDFEAWVKLTLRRAKRSVITTGNDTVGEADEAEGAV